MKIIEERTRLIFTEYNDLEKRRIEDLVATDDKAFTYEDPDNHIIAFPPGMKNKVHNAFPKIPIEDHTKSYWEFARINHVDHDMKPRNQLQIDCIKFILECANNKEKAAAILSPGTGKGNPYSTPIPTPNGWTTMGKLKVGDEIFGSNGDIIVVEDIYERGIEDVYKITFNDGRTAYCDADHLWNVKYYWTNTYTTLSTKEMIKNFRILDKYKLKDPNRDPYKYRYKIPLLSSPVQYHHRDTKIHPYVIGALIGNGCLTERSLTLSSGDDYVPRKIARLTGLYIKYPLHDNEYRYVFYHDPSLKGFPVITDEFLGSVSDIICLSNDKKIPDDYMYNDVESRIQLLQGLMDTDGSILYCKGRFNVTYTSTSRILLKQIQELIRGLGFIANIGSSDRRENKYSTGYCTSVSIRVPNKFKQELFTHPKKHKIAMEAALRGDYQQPFEHLVIKNIEIDHKEECRCIRVSAKDELYLMDQFIVTHNTFIACFCAIRVGARALMIAPTSGIKQQWADTLTEMFNVDPSRVKLVSKPADFINVKSDFVVVSQASLAVLNKTYNLEKIMKSNKFGIKIIDEVQMWWHNMIKIDGNSNICHNWYLTGTFGRSGEDENKIYQEMYGDLHMFREKDKKPTLFNRKPGNIYGMKPHMHINMIWTKSGLSKEEISSCMTSMRYSERAEKWVRYGISIAKHTELVIPSDGTMTKFLNVILKVIKTAEKEVKYGKTLILGSTINSAEVVAAYVRKMFPDKKVYTYHSRNSAQENAEAKEEADIMVSTVSSAGTGFDWKGLGKLIVYAQYKSWILADQISGRLRRRDDGKDTYMWDIVDSEIGQLRAWANARADVEKRKAKMFKVIDM